MNEIMETIMHRRAIRRFSDSQIEKDMTNHIRLTFFIKLMLFNERNNIIHSPQVIFDFRF